MSQKARSRRTLVVKIRDNRSGSAREGPVARGRLHRLHDTPVLGLAEKRIPRVPGVLGTSPASRSPSRCRRSSGTGRSPPGSRARRERRRDGEARVGERRRAMPCAPPDVRRDDAAQQFLFSGISVSRRSRGRREPHRLDIVGLLDPDRHRARVLAGGEVLLHEAKRRRGRCRRGSRVNGAVQPVPDRGQSARKRAERHMRRAPPARTRDRPRSAPAEDAQTADALAPQPVELLACAACRRRRSSARAVGDRLAASFACWNSPPA
jgi:hypothetical protein